MAAIANFASRSASMTLSTPNIGDYAGLLTSLMGTKLPGLDPTGSAAVLDAADNAIRAGGGMGLAGLNFSYAALMRGTPGLTNPVEAEALWQGGLVGTTAKACSAPASAIGDYMGASHGVSSARSDRRNEFRQDARRSCRQQYGRQSLVLPGCHAEFLRPEVDLSGRGPHGHESDRPDSSQKLLGRPGLKLSDLSATGIQGVAAIAGASNMGDLQESLSGHLGAVRYLGCREGVAAGRGPHWKFRHPPECPGQGRRNARTSRSRKVSETRATIADMKNRADATSADLLMGPSNDIRIAVEKMAGIAGVPRAPPNSLTIRSPPTPTAARP